MEPVSNLEGMPTTMSLDAGRMAPASDVSLSNPPSSRLRPQSPVYWRVEGSLLEMTTVRPIAFFTWNSQTFIARAARRSLVLVMALLRPFLYAANRVAATRIGSFMPYCAGLLATGSICLVKKSSSTS